MLETVRKLIETKIPFTARMGLKLLEFGPRRVRLGAPLAGNENHLGTMYAGALFTLGEVPGGALCFGTFDTKRFVPLVKEMTIRYVAPATSDVTVEVGLSEEEADRIRSEAEARGKSDFVLEGQLVDAAGQVVAHTRGLYQLRKIGG